MKFKKGDRVRFLNDIGGGVITRVMDEKMVHVRTHDGFEIPVLKNELVLDTGSYSREDENAGKATVDNGQPLEEDSFPGPSIETGDIYEESPELHVLFALVNPGAVFKLNELDAYLVNDSNYMIYYSISFTAGDKASYMSSGMLEPDTKLYLDDFDINQLFNHDKMIIQVLFFGTGEFKWQPPANYSINTKEITILKARDLKVNDYFDEQAYVVDIIEMKQGDSVDNKQLEKMLQEKLMEKEATGKKERKKENKKQEEQEEVDLHIHEIVDDYKDLSNSEILKIQLDRFETSLLTAINSGTKRIIFIHGIGNGILKHQIGNILNKKYPDLSYQDASFKEYGYGATLVYLRK